MKWINPLKIFFHCLADLDLENFLSKFEVVVGGGSKTKNAGDFMKWINPLKIFFHCLANLDLEHFLSKFQVVGGGVKNHTWIKNAGNFMKWINPLKKFFFSLFGWSGLKMRDDNHSQLPILTLIFMSLSYHIQCSSNLYNKAWFHQAIKMRGDNPILTTNPNT